MNKPLYLIAAMMISVALMACGGSASSEGSETSSSTPQVEEKSTSEAPVPTGEVVEVAISGNDMMKYDTELIEVPAGATVKLTLTHAGQLPKAAMGHNFVLLKQGVDIQAFATKAIAAVSTDYIPADEKGNIIANTNMIGGGESTSIEFVAPAAGEYDFICSFPGHWGQMKGKFVVK